MTGGNRSGDATITSLNLASTYPCKLKGKGIRWLLFMLAFVWRAFWIPAFAGMTGANIRDPLTSIRAWLGRVRVWERLGDAAGGRASLSESGFSGLRFARLALFAITGNPAKTIADGRLPVEYARRGILKIL